MADAWKAQTDLASVLGKGSGSRKRKRGGVLSKADFANQLSTTTPSEDYGDLPEIAQRAIKGEFGAQRAKSAYETLMSSGYSDDVKKQFQAVYEGKGDGPKDSSLLHKLTHNPATNAIGTGLMLIDKPKRVIAATIDAAVEAAYDSGDGKSWVDHVLREGSYGFGDVWENAKRIDTDPNARGGGGSNNDGKLFGSKSVQDSKWTGRGVGLAGDIAGDPLSYVGAGAVSKATEAVEGGAHLGANAVARRLAEAGDLEAAKLVKQKGISAVSKATLAKVDVEGGLKLSRGVELVDHDTVRKVTKYLGELKGAAGDSKAMRGLQKVLGADELKELRTITRDRGASAEEVAKALAHIDAKRTARLATGRLGGSLARDLEELLSHAKAKGVDGEVIRGAVTGDEAAAAKLAERLGDKGAKRFQVWLDKARTEANKLGADPEGWIAFSGSDYMPRYLTPEAMDTVAKRSSGKAASFERRAARAGDEFGDEVLGSPELHARFSEGMVPDSRAAIESQMQGLIREWTGNPALQVFTQNAYEDLPRYLKGVVNRTKVMKEAEQLSVRGVAEPIERVLRDDIEGSRPAFQAFSKAEKEAASARAASDSLSGRLAKLTDRQGDLQGRLDAIAAQGDGVARTSDTIIDRLNQGVPEVPDIGALEGQADGLVKLLSAIPSQQLDDKAVLAEMSQRIGQHEGIVGEFKGGLTQQLADTAKPLKNAKVRASRGAAALERDEARLAQALADGEGVPEAKAAVRATKARIRQAEGEAKKLGTTQAKARESLASVSEGVPVGPKVVRDSMRQLAELRPRFDSFADAAKMARADGNAMLDEAMGRLGEVQDEIAKATELDAQRVATLNQVNEVRTAQVETLKRLQSETDTHLRTLLALEAQSQELSAQHLESLTKAVDMEDFVRKMQKPQMQQFFQEQLKDAFHSMAEYGLKDLQLSDFHYQALERTVEVAKDPQFLVKYLDKANRFFKTYAILTPGFHIRNSLGATFNNFVAGVGFDSYREVGHNLGRFTKGGIEGVKPGPFRDFLVELEKSGGILWDDAQVASELGEFGTKQKYLIDKFGSNKLTRNVGVTENAVTSTSQDIGKVVERYQRTVLAWDTYKKSGSLDEALDKVAQFHFDYSDLSGQEQRFAKRVVPFWTWTSRNLPLQMEMVLREPKMYQRFAAIKNNLGSDDNPELVPSWMKDGATTINLGGGSYLTPEIPSAKADELTRGLFNEGPTSLLQSVTPVLKAPLELKFGKQAWNGAPISDKRTAIPKAWTIIPGMVPALRGLGAMNGDKDKDGNYLISGRAAYMVEQAWPTLAKGRRLAPSEKKYQERRISSILSFFGVGLRTVTEADKTAETFRIYDKLQTYVDRGKETGKVQSKQGR